MKNQELNRRAFLKNVTLLGSVVAGGSLLSACGGGDDAPAPMADAPAEAPMAAEAAGCSDLSGLTDQEKSMRTTLQYVEVSEVEGKNCTNCSFYTQEEGAACGGCTLIKGPIAPNGYCVSWAPKQA